MPSTNYALHNYATDGATVSAARLSKPARVVDRAMHYGLTLLPDGRTSGALIATNKRIAYPGQDEPDEGAPDDEARGPHSESIVKSV